MATTAAYTRNLPKDDLQALIFQADMVRETVASPGWRFVLDAIEDHESRMLTQLLNETTKAEDIPRLRGLVTGLHSMREAAESILEFATEREREANQRTAQELANV